MASVSPSVYHASSSFSLGTQPSPEKVGRRFPILNELELKGLLAEQQQLKAQFDRDHNPTTEVLLLRARLTEFKSSYQRAKDAWKKTEKDLHAAQASLRAKDVQIENLREERTQMASLKRRHDEECEEMKKEVSVKVKKLDDAEAKNQHLSTQLKQMEVEKNKNESLQKEICELRGVLTELQASQVSQVKRVQAILAPRTLKPSAASPQTFL